MNDERRSDSSGAVVAIVLILGILFLVGLVVVVGAGALFFVAWESSPVTMPVQVQSAPMPAVMPPRPPDDLEPAASIFEEPAPAAAKE